MSQFGEKWARPIAQGLASSAIWGTLGAIAIGLGAMTPVIQQFAPLSYLFVALVALTAASLLAGAVGWAKRQWFGSAVKEVERNASPQQIVPYDDSKLRQEFAELKALYLAVVEDYQRMSGVETRLNSLAQELEGVPQKAENTRARAEHAHTLIAQLGQKLEKESRQRALSFHGLQLAETLQGFERQLEEGSATLYERFSRGERYDAAEWEEWEKSFDQWHNVLKNWAQAARWYAADVERRTLAVRPEDFDGEWTVKDDQFPSADALRRFKFHRLLWRNWQDVREDVWSGHRMITYFGMNEKDVQGASATKLGIQPL